MYVHMYELLVMLCAVDCIWEWGEYTDCTKECGGGTKTRYPIITQYPENGGRPCPSHVIRNESESTDCNTHSCPSKLRGNGVSIGICTHFVNWNTGVLNKNV